MILFEYLAGVTHIFKGEISIIKSGQYAGSKVAQGLHSTALLDSTTERIADYVIKEAKLADGSPTYELSKIKPIDAETVPYRAFIEEFDSSSGTWIRKVQPSTFFPNSWSADRILSEARLAFNKNRLDLSGKVIWDIQKRGSTISSYTTFASDGITKVKVVLLDSGKINTFYILK